ncbi:MAG: 30S ribosomal protein S5 [Patescibacteria group bacterium]
MEPENTKNTTTETTEIIGTLPVEVVAEAAPVADAPVVAPAVEQKIDQRDARRSRGDFKKNPRRPQRRESRVKPEFDQKIISIRRVARVVAGGRRFSFSVALVAGNRKGSVGVGLGKAGDTSIAIEKALRDAKKNMVTVTLTKHGSVPHESEAKYSASRVLVIPAPGRGMVAGSSVRVVLELAGVKDVGAKIRSGSKNKINNARAAIEALRTLSKSNRPSASQVK